MKVKAALKAKIIAYWKDREFSAGYTGMKIFQQALKTEANITINDDDLYNILHSIPDYVMHIRRVKRFPRRHYNVRGYLKEVECDLAQMFKFEGYSFFLVTIDLWSRRINARALLNKQADTVRKAFEEIFEDYGAFPETLSSDMGSEFKGN